MLTRIALSLTTLLGVAIVQAQTIIPKPDSEGRRGEIARFAQQTAMEKFDTADTDKDGKLSLKELEAHAPYLAQKFKERDKDGDGLINWEEYVGHNRWPR